MAVHSDTDMPVSEKALEKKLDTLRTLIDMSSIISSTLDLNDLMQLFMEKAKQELQAEACSILFYNRDANRLEFEIAMCDEKNTSEILKRKITLELGQGIAGWVAKNLQSLVIDDVQSDPRFYCEADKQTGFKTKSIIAVPLVGRRGLVGVVELINPKRKDYDLEVFGLLCKQFAIAIENAQLHKESIEKEKTKQEIEFAAIIQKSFLPVSPTFKKGCISVSAINIPALKIGGDLYDFIDLHDNKLGILIGDVSGKGISAALYMAKIISDFRYIAHLEKSPDIVLNRLNTLIAKAPRGIFLTAIYLIADTVSGHLLIAVAGHPPFLWISGGEVKVMNVEAGPPLGIMDIDYPVTSISMKQGNRLLLLTDGAFEAKNREGQRMGFDDLTAFVKNHYHEERLLEMIQEQINIFSKGMDRADDLTLVELRFAG